MPKDSLLTITEMAELLKVSRATLYRWRKKQVGPAFIRVGTSRGGTVRYFPLADPSPKFEEAT